MFASLMTFYHFTRCAATKSGRGTCPRQVASRLDHLKNHLPCDPALLQRPMRLGDLLQRQHQSDLRLEGPGGNPGPDTMLDRRGEPGLLMDRATAQRCAGDLDAFLH